MEFEFEKLLLDLHRSEFGGDRESGLCGAGVGVFVSFLDHVVELDLQRFSLPEMLS